MTDKTSGDQPVMRLETPADVVAAIPYLVGFHPQDSLVVLGHGGPQRSMAARFDLAPERAAGRLADHIAEVLAVHEFPHAVVVGYGTDELVTPVMDEVRRALSDSPVKLGAALRVADGRWWSYLCEEHSCCPAEGSPIDLEASRVAAEAVADGRVALPDRESLERSIAPVEGLARASMRQATLRAEARFTVWVRDLPDVASVRQRMVEEGIALVRSYVRRMGTAGNRMLTDDETAWLGVMLTHLRVRDEAWAHIGEDDLDRHVAFWREVLRWVEEPYAAGPACLLAFAAWRSGEGALANIALERALDSDPGYTMALLLRELLDRCVPPTAVRHLLSPEDLDKAWERTMTRREVPRRPGDRAGPKRSRKGGNGKRAEGKQSRPPNPRGTRSKRSGAKGSGGKNRNKKAS